MIKIQELYAFWKSSHFPYCLWGKIEKFDGTRVYITSYQGWFYPDVIMDEESAKELIEKLKNLTALRDKRISEVQKCFKEELNRVFPQLKVS